MPLQTAEFSSQNTTSSGSSLSNKNSAIYTSSLPLYFGYPLQILIQEIQPGIYPIHLSLNEQQ